MVGETISHPYTTLSYTKTGLTAGTTYKFRLRAENALGPLDHKIIGVKHVSLDEFAMPYPTPSYKTASYDMMESARAPTPVFSSEQDVTTSANVVFIIGSN